MLAEMGGQFGYRKVRAPESGAAREEGAAYPPQPTPTMGPLVAPAGRPLHQPIIPPPQARTPGSPFTPVVLLGSLPLLLLVVLPMPLVVTSLMVLVLLPVVAPPMLLLLVLLQLLVRVLPAVVIVLVVVVIMRHRRRLVVVLVRGPPAVVVMVVRRVMPVVVVVVVVPLVVLRSGFGRGVGSGSYELATPLYKL